VRRIATILGCPTAELTGHRTEDVPPAPVALQASRRLDEVIECGVSCRVPQDADVADGSVSIETTSTRNFGNGHLPQGEPHEATIVMIGGARIGDFDFAMDASKWLCWYIDWNPASWLRLERPGPLL
jgi:hypothetical protein